VLNPLITNPFIKWRFKAYWVHLDKNIYTTTLFKIIVTNQLNITTS
ncbi:hypothetical protein HPSS1190_03644, partial [Helicobacter pylori SS1_190]